MTEINKQEVFNYVLIHSLWYMWNSYNFTADMGGFKFDYNQIKENTKDYEKFMKKLHRILAGNIFEYTLIYYLESAGYKLETDKDNPFKEDTGVDITIIKDRNGNDIKIPLHLKASSIKSLVGQTRGYLKKTYLKEGGYLGLAYIPYNITKVFSNIIDKFLEIGYDFPGDEYDKYSTDDIVTMVNKVEKQYPNIKEELDYLFNKEIIKSISFSQLNNYNDNSLGIVNILGFIDVNDYFSDNYTKFIAKGETLPGGKFKQFFDDGSYFIKPGVELISLNSILN